METPKLQNLRESEGPDIDQPARGPTVIIYSFFGSLWISWSIIGAQVLELCSL